MINPELVSYIKESFGRGQSETDVRFSLHAAGWQDSDIAEGIQVARSVTAVPQNAPATKAVEQTSGSKMASEAMQAALGLSAHKRFPAKMAIMIVALLVLIGGGGGAYYYYFVKQASQKTGLQASILEFNAIHESIIALAQAKTLHVKTVIENVDLAAIKNMASGMPDATLMLASMLALVPPLPTAQEEGKASQGFPFLFTLTAEGNVDIGGDYNYSSDGTVSFRLNGAVPGIPVIEANVEGKFIGDKNVAYLKVNKVPKGIPIDASPIEGKWIRMPVVRESLSTASSTPSLGSGSGDLFGEKPTKEEIDEAKKAYAEIRARFAESGILEVTEALADETIGDIPVSHVKFTINKEKLKKFVLDASVIFAEHLEKSTGNEKVDAVQEKQRELSAAQIDLIFSEWGPLIKSGDMWIGKNDKLPYRIVATTEFADPSACLGGQESPCTTRLSVRTSIELSNYNQPIVEVEPEQSIAFEKAMELVAGDFIKQSRDSRRSVELVMLSQAIDFSAGNTLSPSMCVAGKIYKSNQGSTAVDGTGWLPINFEEMPIGDSIDTLPLDSVNDAKYFYSYACDPKNFDYELNARFESSQFSNRAIEDGGNNPAVYEVGNNKKLMR